MRFGSLIVLLAFLMSVSMSANAQYTSKSTNSAGFTTKSAGTTAQPKAKTNSRQTPSAATKKAPAQASFRPRPQQTSAQAKAPATNDDELPSFDVFENNGSTETANLPPPPPPKGEVWVYIADFKQSDLTGMTMNCDWKIIVQNRTDTPIDSMSLKYHLLDLQFTLKVPQTKEGSSFMKDHAVFNSKCPALARIRPKVNVTKCKFGPLKDQECAEYIVVK